LYRWEYGDNSFDTTDVPETEHLYTEAGLYDVSFKMWDEAGCSDSATLYNVEVLDSLFVPNVFTPNNDGVNDIFYIYSNGYTEFTLKVYNRWGNMVYSTTAPVIYWDGKTTSGIELNTGVYYYTLESVSKADNKRKQTGFFHLYK
jgi:gliding motility-associated-like protein